jgi:hypothetical protein
VRQNAVGTGNCTPPDSCNLYGCVRGECSLQFTIPCADDNNPCTDEVCPGGVCTHRPKADGSPCNQDRCPVGNGVCQAGQCVGQATWNCDDGNPCTNDTCSIAGGYCQHDPVSCDDGNQCTFDTCNPATGACGHALTSCDDGNLCTTDLPCSPNAGCVHTVCDDGNECTRDTCLSPQTGACSHAPIPGPCDDHNPCTFNDTCSTNAQGQFVCIGSSACPSDNNQCTDDIPDPDTCECFHAPHDCSDGIACTTDTCATSTGCAHQPHPAAAAVAVTFGSNQTATWGPSNDATFWNTYRGSIPGALMGSRPSGAYDHTCFESADAFGDGATLTTDAAIPPPGTGYYYFVSGENPCGESALGSGDSGVGGGSTPVPNPAPCPTPP